jgi:hypothetical protein
MNILKAALLHYYETVELTDPEEAASLQNLIAETVELDRLMQDDNEIWPNEIRLISISSACDLGNVVLYDAYGKLARANNNEEVPFERFALNARKEFGCETLTELVLRDAWEIVSSLWLDNETAESNNADGSFNHTV